jgi:hypothetical protein
MAFIFTLMELGMMDSILMTKRKDMGYTIGLMDENMKAGGTKGNNMVLVRILIVLRVPLSMVYGSLVNV